jgi:putative protease
MNKERKTELLAPAGNMESLKAAVAGGCDAVYLGLQSFSARAFAGNFSHEEFQEAIRYCHIHGVKIYVTINTMLFENEIENAKKEVDFLYHNDCDGILIQDLGLFHYVRTCYPDMDVHCSTQMHIHNLAGVKYMQKEGAKRVVMARETPIEIIREACKTGEEIEVFAYGAICISYSGQCLFSSSVKNRSANRGMCAQCCRLQYYPEKGKHFAEGDYILSPKDLNVIDHLPELIHAGVASLKIEGRMKRPEYVFLVTRIFREAIDACYAGQPYTVSEEHQKELLLMFNRGFSKGHLFHDDVTARMSQFRPNHQGMEIGKVVRFDHGRVLVKLTAPLYQHDGLRILNEPHDTGLTAVRIEKNGLLVDHGDAGDEVYLDCHSKPVPRPGQSLRKTTDSRLIQKIDAEIAEPAKIPVSMHYEAWPGAPLTVTIDDHEGHSCTVLSDEECETARKAPLSQEKMEASLCKTGDSAYAVTRIEGETGHVFLPVSRLNETRRKAIAALDEARAIRHVRKGKQAYHLDLKQPEAPSYKVYARDIQASDHEDLCILDKTNVLPVVDENNAGHDMTKGMVLSSVGDLSGKHEKCLAGMTMNLANSYALAYVLSKPGVCGAMVSSELSNEQIHAMLEAFEARYGFTPYTVQLVYGRRTIMYIKDGFRKDHTLKQMEDMHENVYPLTYNESITMIHEPQPVRHENRWCSASLVLLDQEKHPEEILEETYEELYQRI